LGEALIVEEVPFIIKAQVSKVGEIKASLQKVARVMQSLFQNPTKEIENFQLGPVGYQHTDQGKPLHTPILKYRIAVRHLQLNHIE
jgi:hypothetical protein